MDGLLQDITIYHEGNKYNLRASVRNTEYLNRNRTGLMKADNTLVRVFDTDGYGSTWNVKKGDIIVLDNASEMVGDAPLTELREIYGKEKVIEVSTIDKYIFDTLDNKIIQHIKIGGR